MIVLAAALALGAVAPAFGQQGATAGELLKQGYTFGLEHPGSWMFTLHKGSTSFACHYEDLLKKERQDKPAGSGDKAEAWARVLRSAPCREI
jgi:hypothetical protein